MPRDNNGSGKKILQREGSSSSTSTESGSISHEDEDEFFDIQTESESISHKDEFFDVYIPPRDEENVGSWRQIFGNLSKSVYNTLIAVGEIVSASGDDSEFVEYLNHQGQAFQNLSKDAAEAVQNAGDQVVESADTALLNSLVCLYCATKRIPDANTLQNLVEQGKLLVINAALQNQTGKTIKDVQNEIKKNLVDILKPLLEKNDATPEANLKKAMKILATAIASAGVINKSAPLAAIEYAKQLSSDNSQKLVGLAMVALCGTVYGLHGSFIGAYNVSPTQFIGGVTATATSAAALSLAIASAIALALPQHILTEQFINDVVDEIDKFANNSTLESSRKAKLDIAIIRKLLNAGFSGGDMEAPLREATLALAKLHKTEVVDQILKNIPFLNKNRTFVEEAVYSAVEIITTAEKYIVKIEAEIETLNKEIKNLNLPEQEREHLEKKITALRQLIDEEKNKTTKILQEHIVSLVSPILVMGAKATVKAGVNMATNAVIENSFKSAFSLISPIVNFSETVVNPKPESPISAAQPEPIVKGLIGHFNHMKQSAAKLLPTRRSESEVQRVGVVSEQNKRIEERLATQQSARNTKNERDKKNSTRTHPPKKSTS